MNQRERLLFCENCIHQNINIKNGVTCNLTQQKPDFEISCKNFNKDNIKIKKNEINIKKDVTLNLIETENIHNKHKTFWLLIALSIIIIILSYKYIKLKNNKVLFDDIKKEKLYDERELQRKTRQKNTQQKAIYYLANKNRVKIKRKKVKKDTSFMIAKRLKLIMHKKYYMSILKNNELPVLSIYRGYSFTYNKVIKDKSKSLSEQWINYRRTLAPGIKVFDVKKYEFEGIKVEEKNFMIPGARNIYGVSKLIEIDENRYYFHYFFKQEFEDYNMLRKYLNFYIKIK